MFSTRTFCQRKKCKLGLVGYTTPLVFGGQIAQKQPALPKKTNDAVFFLFASLLRPLDARWFWLIWNFVKISQHFFKINSLIIIFERFLGRFRRRRTCKLGLARRLGDQNHWQPCHFQVKFHSSNQQETKNNCIQIQQSTPTNVNQHQSKSITYQHE